MDSQALEVENELALAWQYVFKRDLTNALQVAQKASTRAPQSAEVAHVLGVIASRDGRPDIALPLLQKSIEGGATERKLRDMAEALVLAKHPQAALAPIQDCIKQFGESSESLGLLAAIYTSLEEYALASNAAQKAISLKPDGITWQTTVSFCDLIQGQFSSGLPALTFRNQTLVEQGRCPVLNFAQPSELWLKNEQGPGDTLFFLCHAKSLVEKGWRLHVQAHPKIQKVLQQTGLFASVELAFTCPPHGFWINIGDLPLAALQIGFPSPAAPLPLKVDEKLVTKLEKILQKFGPAPYIAVTWRGGVQGKKVRSGVRMGDRYIDTQLLGKTLAQTNATVISVQRVPDSKEANAFERALGRKVMDLSRLNDNLPEMLALMSIVDEYIAVPNTNHHLREALGKPSKIIVNRPYEDWRWSVEGNAPWYPNAQCYRQMADGSLEHVFSDITRDLNKSLPVTITQPKVRHVANDDVEISHDTEIAQLLADGWAAVGQNDLPAAIQYAQKVMAIYPEHAGAFHLLGWSAMRDLKPDLAVTLLKKGIEITPNDGRIVGDCIRALSVNEQFDEALNVAATALAREDIRNRSSIYYGRAALYLKYSNIKAAIEDYQQCMLINPNRLDAAEYSGMARLKLGDARLGFRESTARKVAQRPELLNDWCCPVLTPQHTGTRVLIKRDMGLGDELTYLRYLPWLTQTGMIVDYWCGKKLKPILERMGYFNHVYADNNAPPTGEGYDLSFIVNDLPVAVESLGAPEIAPPLPLTPRPELVEKWRAWLTAQGPAPYIGINWKAGVGVQGAGNIFSKLAKAVDAELFAKALSGVQATFISLQRNVLSDELKQFEQALGADLHDVTALTDDLDDLLALLSLLDENIGVSNTNMHLRASSGKGSRVMVQKPNGDWRWGVEGEKSLWFTQSIVYRQTDNGDWEAPLQVLSHDLQAQYGERNHSESKAFQHSIIKQNITKTKRLIWLTAGAINHINGKQTSAIASARYRVIAPSEALVEYGWQSEIVNEEVSQVMGGWGSAVPQVGDTLIVSKVFTEHAIHLANDAKNRGASVVVDFCDNLFEHPKRGPLQKKLLKLADIVVAATEGVEHAIETQSRNADALISDPVEMSLKQANFSANKIVKLLWFGHNNNLDSIMSFLPALEKYSKQQLLVFNLVTNLPNGEKDLNKLLPENSKLNIFYTPWSLEATQKAIAEADLVVIPTLESDHKSAKSPNRLLEPLQAGKMVVAGPLPAYLDFADSAWVGENLIEGIQWCLSHPDEVLARIKKGQADIAAHFTQQAIAAQWHQILLTPEKKLINQPKDDGSVPQISPLEPYFQVKEAARVLDLNNQTEAQIKQKYFSLYAKKQMPLAGKMTVYTAIFGGYDTAPILNFVDPNIDYILYTDQLDFIAPSPWQVRVVPTIFKDPQVDARRVKVLSHLFLADYDISVWIDGNFTLEKLTVALVQDIVCRSPVALCKHQFRNCIYDEAIEILKRGIDASTPVLKQMQYYQAREFPAQFGLHATSFLVRNHKDTHTIKMNMRWWELLSTNSKRDQLSFDYVRWENHIPVMSLPFNLRENTLYFWGKNGERKHKVDVRLNDEHDGRALNYNKLTVAVDKLEYQPIFDSWNPIFLKELFSLNHSLLTTNLTLASSVLYDGARSARCLPDPRLGNLQRALLTKICQAKLILQVGFDGGHIALMAIHHSGAKIVILDENLDEYKQVGINYLSKKHAKRVATFSRQDIMQINEAMFDLVCINIVVAEHYHEVIHQLKSLNKATIFVEFNYENKNAKLTPEATNLSDINRYSSDDQCQTYIDLESDKNLLLKLNTKSIQVVNQSLIGSRVPNSEPNVLVGIMYSGENEYQTALHVLDQQSYAGKSYFVIENLPNKLAHDTLYNTFMNKADNFDYFLKLDADMVFAHKNVLLEMVEAMEKDNLAHLFAYVRDCPSGVMIPGIQMFKSDTQWLGSDENLNVDYPPKINGVGKFFYEENWIQHMPDPDEYQLFRYGVHKALKSLQPDRTLKKINKGILHLTILNGIARNLSQDDKLLFALIGATLVYQKAFNSIEYNGEQAKKYFETLKTKPDKFDALKNMAKAFWSNEVQVNYWWIENFGKFSLI